MIPYDLTKIKAFVFDIDGVLSPNVVPTDADGNPARMSNVKDGYALHLAIKHGYKIAIISGADSPTIAKRFNRLGVNDVFIKVGDKLPLLKQWLDNNDLTPDQVIYCGDDIPDLPCINAVGLSVAPSDAAVDVREAVTYVLPIAGGYGVAREVIEQTMRANGTWLHPDTAYVW